MRKFAYLSDVLFFTGAVMALIGVWQFSWALAFVIGGSGLTWLGIEVGKKWG